jgi:hypothetical protein
VRCRLRDLLTHVRVRSLRVLAGAFGSPLVLTASHLPAYESADRLTDWVV